MKRLNAMPQTALVFMFLGFWLAFQLIFQSQPFSDPGALWHIRVGDWIFQHWTFPHTDPFTWSYAGRFWIPQQWGAECAMSLIHHLGGFDSLLTLMNAMLGLLAACIGKRFIDGGLHPLPAAGIVALGMATAGFHFYLRPHLATIILLAVAMAWLVDYERGRISRIRLWLLIPLGIVWTNLHGGVLGCIFTFALAIGGWLAFRTKSRSDIGYLILVLIGCVAATLLNPFFLDMHRTWLSIIGSTVLKAEVSEHQPLSLCVRMARRLSASPSSIC